jgi:hypothetical protein
MKAKKARKKRKTIPETNNQSQTTNKEKTNNKK